MTGLIKKENISTENMVFNKDIIVEKYVVDVEHGRKDFLRKAANMIATIMMENNCLIHRDEYDIDKDVFHTQVTILVAQRQRTLP